MLIAGVALIGDESRAATLPTLWIDLAEQNRGVGLAVPSAGDGVNHPVTVAGRQARRAKTSRHQYLYVRITHHAYTAEPRDVYVTVDVHDDAFRWVELQYDKVDPHPNIGSRYTTCRRKALLTGSGTWQRHHFCLTEVRMAHSQNNGTDFRLVGSGLTISRIEVSSTPPEGYDPSRKLVAQAVERLRVDTKPQLELTFGNDAGPQEAAVLAALGVTSVESYVDWAGVEPEEGKWDWHKWDTQVETLEQNGLKWVPFLLVGMPYATPMWFQESERSVYYRCLEHGKDNGTQSLFNPDLPERVDRYFAAFAARYRDRGVIESVLLGITGIYGESIYPAGPDGGGWTARLNGPYHNHLGWWAGDRFAVAAFRTAMAKKYGDIAALNKAWGSRHKSFASVTTFLPGRTSEDCARADMAQWYQQAMTDWAALWVRTARKHFPETEIYLCTGGRGTPELGADFTAQAKAIAPYAAGIRITNEGSDYARNFTITREVATATRFYNTFAGFEPAGQVNARGVVARIYNATASGAHQLHFYQHNVLAGKEPLDSFRANVENLVRLHVSVSVAFYVSRESWDVDLDLNGPMYAHAHVLRDVTDYDMVTRTTVVDGILDRYRALVITTSPVLEPAVAERIEAWVRRGGVLIVAGESSRAVGTRLHDLKVWRERLLGPPNGSRREVGRGATYNLTGKGSPRQTWSAGAAILRAGEEPIITADGKLDGRYATKTERGVIWYDGGKEIRWEKRPRK